MMASTRIETRIESLLAAGEWESAEKVVTKQLAKEPDDHWLWSRLSGAKYERRDHQGALEAAEKALEFVPDCPLALWSYAGAVEMLGRTRDAVKVYLQLIRRGVEELTQPDEDANECWEGADWTRGLVLDCIFRVAGCLAKLGKPDEAVEWYSHFLNVLPFGMQGIYSREDATARMKKLSTGKKAAPDVMARMKKLEAVMG